MDVNQELKLFENWKESGWSGGGLVDVNHELKLL